MGFRRDLAAGLEPLERLLEDPEMELLSMNRALSRVPVLSGPAAPPPGRATLMSDPRRWGRVIDPDTGSVLGPMSAG